MRCDAHEWGGHSTLDKTMARYACYGPKLGYTIPTSLLSLVGLSASLANIALTALLTLLVLHLVCGALSLLILVLGAPFLHAHAAAILALIAAITTALLASAVLAADIALVVPPGWDGPFGLGLSTAGTVVTVIAGALIGSGAIYVVNTM